MLDAIARSLIETGVIMKELPERPHRERTFSAVQAVEVSEFIVVPAKDCSAVSALVSHVIATTMAMTGMTITAISMISLLTTSLLTTSLQSQQLRTMLPRRRSKTGKVRFTPYYIYRFIS